MSKRTAASVSARSSRNSASKECVQAGTSIVIGGDIRLKKRLEGP
jgi:hypothetical protein